MERMHLSGDVTIYRAQALKDEVVAAIKRGSDLEIDLGGITAVDTTAVQLLLMAKRETGARGGRLSLVNHSAPVVEALDLYGLSAFFGDPVLFTDASGG